MPTYGWNGTVDAGFAACARLPTRTLQRAVEKNHDARTPDLFISCTPPKLQPSPAQVTKVKRAARRVRSEAGAAVL